MARKRRAGRAAGVATLGASAEAECRGRPGVVALVVAADGAVDARRGRRKVEAPPMQVAGVSITVGESAMVVRAITRK